MALAVLVELVGDDMALFPLPTNSSRAARREHVDEVAVREVGGVFEREVRLSESRDRGRPTVALRAVKEAGR